MSKIFKIDGGLIQEILTKDVKNFQIVNYYQDDSYINYGGTYISLTRINYENAELFDLPNSRPGQIVGGFIDGLVTQITGITIHENVVYQTDCTNKGRAINNFNERSDLYTFSLPTFFISGATKIMTGTTTASTGVYIVDTLSALTFNLIFTADSNFSSFFINNNGIKFDLYQRSTPTIISVSNSIGNSLVLVPNISNPIFGPNLTTSTQYFTLSNFSSYSTTYSSTTFSYDLSSFEGEFLIKGLFKWTNFTYFSNLINLQYYEPNGLGLFPYSLYDSERDYYFVYLKKAEKPNLFTNIIQSTTLPLNVVSIVPNINGQTSFPLILGSTFTSTNSIMVSVNGLTLSTSEYYYSANTLFITSGTLLTSDIITVVHSNGDNTPPIQTESYTITSIPNTTYPSVGEKVIYNTSTNKYEYWLNYEPTNQPVLTVNGQTLSNEIDFYVSSSDRRRMIFEGSLSVGDVITVFYNSIIQNNNFIVSNIYPLSWSLNDVPKNNSGYFYVELTTGSDTTFSNPIFTASTIYVQNQPIYTINLTFNSGTYGDKFLVRVTNYKNYYTILNELLQTSISSDIIPLTIGTNALNNY
jgi:hypothetical protein